MGTIIVPSQRVIHHFANQIFPLLHDLKASVEVAGEMTGCFERAVPAAAGAMVTASSQS